MEIITDQEAKKIGRLLVAVADDENEGSECN